MHTDVKKIARPATSPVVMQPVEDLRLADRVERVLRASGYEPLRAVAVSVIDRVVVLQGQVPSYFLKQIAQATALAIPGAHQIHNCLDVVPPKRHGQDEGRTAPTNSFHLKEIPR
jgi:osmotically-inducible protein OsmY